MGIYAFSYIFIIGGGTKKNFAPKYEKMTSTHRSNKFVTISRGTKIPPDKVWAIHCVQILRARRARAKIRQNRDLDPLYITPRVKQMAKRGIFGAYFGVGRRLK
jgi:hypothetical protein